MFPAGAGLELEQGMQPLALVQPEAASEPLQRWDGHRGCPRNGEQPWLPLGQAMAYPAAPPVALPGSCLALVQAFFLESCVREEFSLSGGVTNLPTRLIHALENRMGENISSEALTTA